MGWIIKVIAKAASKAAKVDPTDIMNQQMGSDLLDLIKDVIL